MDRFAVPDYRRLVIKVGSSLLTHDDGQLNSNWLEGLAEDVAALCTDGHQVLIVSSGSIAVGSTVLGINRRRARLADLQASAAAGQVRLVHAYQNALEPHDLAVAQVLLTPGDTEHRRRFMNARATLERLLERGVVPVINENDTVATEEIRYGDNDRLAARVAQLVMADALILLSDVDGLYDADPAVADARHIPHVAAIDADIEAMAGETRSLIGSGGMRTKVEAARIATHAGCVTVVAAGTVERPLRELQSGARHTLFAAARSPAAARKQWLAGKLQPQGMLQIDDGALAALNDGGSLLPVGVSALEGEFRRGDVVRIVNGGREIGRGLSEYPVAEARRIAGRQSREIEGILGFRGPTVLVHRDELILFDNE